MELQMASKMYKNLIKNEIETKSTKNVENVQILIPLDMQETCFRMETLSKITKTRGADKYTKISKKCVEMKPKSMKNRSQNSTKKRSLKTEPQKSKNTRKMTPKWDPKNEYILGEMPIAGPLVVQTVFVMKKWAPSAPKVRPRTKNEPK